jgi:hypothetical protein
VRRPTKRKELAVEKGKQFVPNTERAKKAGRAARRYKEGK